CLVVHYAAEWEFPRDDLFPNLRNSYLHANHVFFVSEKSREIVENQVALDLKCKSSIITCPYNMPYDGGLPFPSTSDGLKLACVARLEPDDKGQDLAIKLLASPKWRARPIELSLYGNGNCRSLIQHLIDFHNSPAVKICGFEPDILKIWNENHVLFLPSRAEGKPLALMESMLCGRVPAVTDVAGNTELVDDMKTGFVAKYPRLDSLDNMLEKLWQQKDNLSNIGKNAYLKARNQLHPDPGRKFAEILVEQFSIV
ncbi:glycosyltransferase family 4 protein, partial [bacterium]|nr:glycosyltransferase family 4 protein [bacterium]